MELKRTSIAKRNEFIAIFISVAFHLLAVFLITVTFIPSLPSKKLEASDVKSYLVIKKKPRTEDVSILPEKELLTKKEPIEAQAVSRKLSETNSLKQMPSPSENVKIEKPTPTKELINKIQSVVVESAATDNIESDIWKNATNPLIEIQSLKPKPDPHRSMSVTGFSNELVQSLNQAAYDALLQSEINTYNKLQNSPIIDTIGTIDTTLFVHDLKPIAIVCNDSVSNSLALISSLLGGTIKCKQHEYNSFIEKRLNKGLDEKSGKKSNKYKKLAN